MKSKVLVIWSLLTISCIGGQVVSDNHVEPLVKSSCGSYKAQCSECMDTLLDVARRTGVPTDKSNCPACNQVDVLCSPTMPDNLKTWPTEIPPPQKRPRLREEDEKEEREKQNKSKTTNSEDDVEVEDTSITHDVEQETE